MRRDIYKEAGALAKDIRYTINNMVAGAEASCDADKMAYARAAEYYLELIAGCINWIRRLSVVMDIKIEAENDKACQEIKTLADIWAVEGSDKMWAERHNNIAIATKRHINHMLTLCSRDGSPLRDLTDDMRQLDRYTCRMQKDLAEKRDKLKKLRMKRVAKE